MKECLLCERDMKKAKTIFGNGCIKSIYNFLKIEMPEKAKDREKFLYKSIMEKLNINNLNSNQKVWLADRYLTLQFVENLKYGNYSELKKELNKDILSIGKIKEFSDFITASKVKLKQAYTLYKKEEKFNNYISQINYKEDTLKVGYKLLWEYNPINLVIRKTTSPFEMNGLKSMQYALWQIVAIGGNVVGFDNSAELLEHSLIEQPKDLYIREGKIVDEIKNDPQFKEKIKNIVEKYGKDCNEFNLDGGEDNSIQFDNSDLYFAIHGASINVKGSKENDKWNLVIKMIDRYDYTKLKDFRDHYKDANSVPKSIFSSFIYNLAYFSVKFGVIKEYFVNIEFNINEYEVD